jgi:hypothetical protein
MVYVRIFTAKRMAENVRLIARNSLLQVDFYLGESLSFAWDLN